MIRRHFDNPDKFEAASFNGTGGLVGRHSQFCPWTARFSQNPSFLAWPLVPVHHRKQSQWCKCIVDRTSQPLSIRYAMEGVCQEHKINRAWPKSIEFISIPRQEIAIRDAAFYETVPRHF